MSLPREIARSFIAVNNFITECISGRGRVSRTQLRQRALQVSRHFPSRMVCDVCRHGWHPGARCEACPCSFQLYDPPAITGAAAESLRAQLQRPTCDVCRHSWHPEARCASCRCSFAPGDPRPVVVARPFDEADHP